MGNTGSCRVPHSSGGPRGGSTRCRPGSGPLLLPLFDSENFDLVMHILVARGRLTCPAVTAALLADVLRWLIPLLTDSHVADGT